MASLTSGSRVKSTVSDAGSVQLLSHVRLFVTPWTAACQASLSKLPEFTQTHVHRVGDAIQQSYPLLSPSPPALNLPQHQGSFQMSRFFASGGQRIGVSASTSALPMNTRTDHLWTGWISLQSKGLSRGFSNTTVQKHQFFSAQLSSQSNSHIHT